MHSLPFDPSALLPVSQAVARASLLAGVLMLLVLALRALFGRRLSPVVRCLLWLPVCALLVAPRLPDVGLGWGSEALQAPQILSHAAPPTEKAHEQAPRVQSAPPPGPAVMAVGQSARSMELGPLLALVWAAGVIVLGTIWLLAFGCLCIRIRKSSAPVPDEMARLFAESARTIGLRHMPAIKVSSAVASPALMGLLCPVLLLPEGLNERLSPEELRMIMLHEAGHVKRHDLIFHWLSLALLTLHWFNPLCWLAAWLFRMDRESACDAAVLRASRQDCRALYGHTLLKLQSSLASAPGFRPLVGVLGSASMLRGRILEIAAPRRTSLGAGILAGAATMIATAGIALMAAEPAPPPASAPPAAPSPDQLVTRTFKVPPDFLSHVQEEVGGGMRTAKQSLEACGVPFPEGASAIFVPATSQLIVRNTAGNVDLVDMLVTELNKPVPQVYVTSRLVVLDDKPAQQGGAAKWKLGGTFTDPQYQVLTRYLQPKGSLPENVKLPMIARSQASAPKVLSVIQLPNVTTKLGQKAIVEIVRELVYPAEFDDKGVCTKNEMRPIGMQLGVNTLLKKDGLEVTLEPHMEGFMRWEEQPPKGGTKFSLPVISSIDLQTVASLHDGETLMFFGDAPVPAILLGGSGKGMDVFKATVHPTLLFVTCRLIMPNGMPVSKEAVPDSAAVKKVPGAEGKPVGQRVKISVTACEISPAVVTSVLAKDPRQRFAAAVKEGIKRDDPAIPGFTVTQLLGALLSAPVSTSPVQKDEVTFRSVVPQEEAGRLMQVLVDKLKAKMHRNDPQTAGTYETLKGFNLGVALPGRPFSVGAKIEPGGEAIEVTCNMFSGSIVGTASDGHTVVLGGMLPQADNKTEKQGLVIFITSEIVP